MPNTHKSIEDTAGELWRCIKEDFEKEGVTLPDNWKGIGMAYGGYARACEILDQFAQQQVQEAVEEVEGMMEELADIEHTRWSKWQAYLHSKCVEHENGKGEWVCFPAELFRRWECQINTPYAELSEQEKESDREQVRPYLAKILSTLKSKQLVVTPPPQETEGDKKESV